MTTKLQKPDITELKPRITVFGVGGGGGNAVNNMISAGLQGVDFVVANTDAQALTMTKAQRILQLGINVTEGLGAGSQPDVGRAAAEECIDEIMEHLNNTHMCFVTAGMGGGTGTGAAPVVAEAARNKGVLTVGVVTKPFHFEGARRMRLAEAGIQELQRCVDTLIVIPNQNLFRIANDKTTFADAFAMADQVLYSGVACITDLMVKEGLINLDFADVRSVMREMGRAMMGTGEASGQGRAMQAAEAAVANPLLDETSMKGSQGLLISITGGRDLTLFEVDEAATRIREEVDPDANIILGATFDEALEGIIRVSVVATGIDRSYLHDDLGKDFRSENQDVKSSVRSDSARALEIVSSTEKQSKLVDLPVQGLRSYIDHSDELHRFKDQGSTKDIPAENIGTNFSDEKNILSQENVFSGASPSKRSHLNFESRMPKAEDFPPLMKAEIDNHSRSTAVNMEDRGPMGLIRRLANSLGRREDGSLNISSSDTFNDSSYRSSSELKEPNIYSSHNTYKSENNKSELKSSAMYEDDQLEIPAFLRRQSS
ncbi:Cell division protein FtsZ [Liberibacter crescens BT-1]|uniref:Cell division protein FtsZ n=1 Tax=Liberibacter crescens (strain BT-1) TaxID=1215343 RepID=L0ESU3_LIBCB|nr:cell division protein FtsZ [Liberibacter crescens]AGA64589.1 Cell division protein FtsZ [Liberibacter crescens BT-1]AMC12721.1 cell division protein FtsZ [Liberibacter crescens]